MTIKTLLSRLSKIPTLSIPKQQYTIEQVQKIFGHNIHEASDAWLVPCKHRINPPATRSDVEKAQQALGFKFPAGLSAFFQQCNGARLFVAPRLGLDRWCP